MRLIFMTLLLGCVVWVQAETVLMSEDAYAIRGRLVDETGAMVSYANVGLYDSNNNSLVKAAFTDDEGIFNFEYIAKGNYFLHVTFIGYDDLRHESIVVVNSDILLGDMEMTASTIQLETAVVKSKRTILEVKSDRLIFNVEGTINSAGGDGFSVLRKAPGVMIDNNDNITVLGRTGVLIYIDGKRLPLSGNDLTSYLRNITVEQIDRIDIITNPGAKYEAEGNAGIIDIRLKKNKNYGTNGLVNANVGQGKFTRSSASFNLNNRNKWMNTYATVGGFDRTSFHEILFLNNQNGLIIDEIDYRERSSRGLNYRLGTDYYIDDHQTVGFLINANNDAGGLNSYNRGIISRASQPNSIDSILIANNETTKSGNNQAYNINYSYNNKGVSTVIDLDYGRYRKNSETFQPNQYYDGNLENLLTKVWTAFTTPVEIDIYTAKLDHERTLWGGQFQVGAKYSQVRTDNTFLFYNLDEPGNKILDNQRSNLFKYDERVYAAYTGYNHSVNEKVSLSGGVRMEITDAVGNLTSFDPSLNEDPVLLNYVDFFPNVGISYAFKPKHKFSLNYGKRINRPDYNVLNPFREQLSELSYSKGNPFLRPEIVHNLELGYTMAYRYNFKLAYSKTYDQITRLIAPAEDDPRAGFLSWENLSEQTIYSANAALPIEFAKWWNTFFNLTATYQNNQATYPNGATVDLQAFGYNIYQQHTFNLPKQFVAEVSGWYSGPGIWGGVFKYDPSWSLNLGIQKKFFKDQLNVKLSAQDIFYQTGWSGSSSFSGLEASGSGSWDSRRGELSLSYNFGNKSVKSRKRKTGLENESKRVKDGN